MRMFFLFCIIAVFSLITSIPAIAVDYYISPDGLDTNTGTIDQPFASLQRAQMAARQAAGREAVNVFLRAGTYYLPETFVLTPADSGTKEAPVTYQAYRDEKPVVSGGVRLNLKWEPYENGIMQAAAPPNLTTDQLFVNGDRQILARYPNFDPNEHIYNGYAADAISPDRVKRWADPTGGFIHAMHANEWGGFHYLITGKKDDGTLTYEGGWQNNRPAPMHPRYRFVENIFEELDSPGEWFLNHKSNILYYYPLARVDLSNATIEVVRLRHLVEFRGTEQAPVRFVTLKGLTFRHAARTFMDNKEPLLRTDWTVYRGGAIFFEGAEDSALIDCFIDQVGGNAVFVNDYNRRVTIRGCQIAKAGANGVAFVGDRAAARVPQSWNDHSQSLATLDRTPGPKTNNYPADCLVDDCLITLSGRVEKQTSPVEIDLAQGITVRHCSLYDCPRAGINIGDGCWGGHVIEFCDIFDTVMETGDHGSFNSWGRDRFWGLNGLDLNQDTVWETDRGIPLLDVVKPNEIRNNRWRCDHGWDIDLDDGSTNYHIYNNLCLHGGIKNREGFFRTVENNVIVGSGFHPHVWFKHSEDIFRHNITWSDAYIPAGGMPSTPWGKEMDYNLVHRAGMKEPLPATRMQAQSHRDEHSIVADAMFVDAANGDFRVKDASPALKLGFVNFPMDQFGVQKPELKAIARTPEIPPLTEPTVGAAGPQNQWADYVLQSLARSISGLGDRSAYGLPDETGVLLLNTPAGSLAAAAGLRKDDVIVSCNGKPVRGVGDLLEMQDQAAGKKLTLSVIRKQGPVSIDVTDYAYSVTEYQSTPDFKAIPLAATDVVLPASVSAGAETHNDPVSVLTDGKIGKSYGPVYGNGVLTGTYKLDLGAVKSISQVNTFSYNMGGGRGRQKFVLFGSSMATDPGWNVGDSRRFTPIADVDTRITPPEDFVATSIRQSGGKPLGSYRWLVWAVSPVTSIGGGENTAFQELQVLPAG